jgi:hypothetical protein
MLHELFDGALCGMTMLLQYRIFEELKDVAAVNRADFATNALCISLPSPQAHVQRKRIRSHYGVTATSQSVGRQPLAAVEGGAACTSA